MIRYEFLEILSVFFKMIHTKDVEQNQIYSIWQWQLSMNSKLHSLFQH